MSRGQWKFYAAGTDDGNRIRPRGEREIFGPLLSDCVATCCKIFQNAVTPCACRFARFNVHRSMFDVRLCRLALSSLLPALCPLQGSKFNVQSSMFKVRGPRPPRALATAPSSLPLRSARAPTRAAEAAALPAPCSELLALRSLPFALRSLRLALCALPFSWMLKVECSPVSLSPSLLALCPWLPALSP